jgi:hypothetical protein
MPDNAIVLLDALLAERDRLRGGDPLPADQAFELFAFEQCLKEEDLSDEEIANGQVGGGDDGGVDGLYCFLNGNLLEEDAEVLQEGFDATSVRREAEPVLAARSRTYSPASLSSFRASQRGRPHARRTPRGEPLICKSASWKSSISGRWSPNRRTSRLCGRQFRTGLRDSFCSTAEF